MRHRRALGGIGPAARMTGPAVAMLVVLAVAACGFDPGLGRVYGPASGPSSAAAATANGGGASEPPGAIASQDFPTGPSAKGPAANASVPQASFALQKKLLHKPSSARAWPAADTGAFGLDDFISRFYVKDAQAHEKVLARNRGFQGAARTGWFNGDGTQEGVFLVGFADGTGAEAMYEGLSAGWDDDSRLTTFNDGEVQGKGAVTTTADELGNVDVRIMFYVNSTFGEIHYWAKSADKSAARAVALAQYQALF